MPLIKSAIKKLRKDKKRAAHNLALKRRYKELIKKALREPTEKNKKAAVSAIDKAAKRNVIHKNKAARLKSRVMKTRKGKVEKGKEGKKEKKKRDTRKKKTAKSKKKSAKSADEKGK